MRTISTFRLKPHTVKALLAVLIIGIGLAGSGMSIASADGITLNAARECDSKAIIKCGVLSSDELLREYDDSTYAQKVYAYFGITKSDMQNIATTARAGSVNADGNVYIKGVSSPVAAKAYSAAAQNGNGGSKVTVSGVTFYKLPTSSVVTSNSSDAFVVMQGSKFKFAIIASGGNPVAVATPAVAKPVSPTTPATPIEPTESPSSLVNTGTSTSELAALFICTTVSGIAVARRYQVRHG